VSEKGNSNVVWTRLRERRPPVGFPWVKTLVRLENKDTVPPLNKRFAGANIHQNWAKFNSNPATAAATV